LVVGVGGQRALVIGGLGSLAVGAVGLMVLAFVQVNAGDQPPVIHVEDAGAPEREPEPVDAPDGFRPTPVDAPDGFRPTPW